MGTKNVTKNGHPNERPKWIPKMGTQNGKGPKRVPRIVSKMGAQGRHPNWMLKWKPMPEPERHVSKAREAWFVKHA